VIYCGENDFAYADTVSVAEVVRRFKTLYGMLRQNLPATTISFVSMKPSPVREKLQDKIKAANNEIKLFLKKESRAAFIDIYPAMLDAKGKMREELYEEDRLHMKAEGYRIWQRIMLPYLIK
jgi:lysophospholipase L1-like esterase